MPIYEYICLACKTNIEVLQKISDPPLEVCPDCQEKKLKKKTSLTSFQLKGQGWYKDGYSSKKGEAASTDKKSKDTSSDKTSKGDQKGSGKESKSDQKSSSKKSKNDQKSSDKKAS